MKEFNAQADKALLAMKRRAEKIGIHGVAMVAWSEGRRVDSWSSKMLAVGSPITGLSIAKPVVMENYLAIAYTKASEMASTLKNSGSGVRQPFKGEHGWKGGAMRKVKGGYLFAAFSGGPSADDVKVSRVGLDVLEKMF